MNINERIKKIREKFCNNSNKDFAERLGVAPNTASNYIKDGYSIGLNVVQYIQEKFPEVSVEWLISGSGEMLKQNINQQGDRNVNIGDGSNGNSIHIGGNTANTIGMSREELLEIVTNTHLKYVKAVEDSFAFLKEKEKDIKARDETIERQNKVVDRQSVERSELVRQVSEMQKQIGVLIERNNLLTDKLIEKSNN